MKFAICLHGAAVARAALGLHATDRRAIALARSLGADVVAVEAGGDPASPPAAAEAALKAGADRAVRIVEPALANTDAHAAGFVLASVLDRLDVDLILFGDDADPEGLTDVPASIAHHMGALYLTGALKVDAATSAEGVIDTEAIDVTVRTGPWIRRLRLPFNAVVGIADASLASLDAAMAPTAATVERRAESGGSGGSGGDAGPAVQVLTLADLTIDPALVRRRDDLRGVVERAPRPLVTLQSAAAVGVLLRRI